MPVLIIVPDLFASLLLLYEQNVLSEGLQGSIEKDIQGNYREIIPKLVKK
jgi:hypothetical protein